MGGSPGWQPALEAARPRLLALLDAPDPRVRRAATLLVALLDAEDLQVRLAAVHALAGSDSGVAARRVDVPVRAVLDPDAARWRDSAWLGGTSTTLVHATGELPAADPVAATAFATGVARRGHPPICGWPPSGTPSRCSPGGAPPPRAFCRCWAAAWTTMSPRCVYVGDAAVWALARQGHPGCLPGLADRLSGGRLGFDTEIVHFGRTHPVPAQPAICEVLIPLREHSGVLLGPLAARRDLAPNVCTVVAAAAAALPVLVDAAAEPKLRPSAARALGAIGLTARDAVATLRDSAAEPAVAWALWRVTGDSAEATAVLTGPAGPLARGDCPPAGAAALHHLAVIGTAGDRVRAVARADASALLDRPGSRTCAERR
ncbi:hypothetical protein AB0F52_26150 [Amycolatopsis sp. NPDC024027]|uniref:hypothetical protein n=1 Tax=Amycolatopsis sp. NPDC024027 TaxID=3154327 RepID=UPI0033FF170E